MPTKRKKPTKPKIKRTKPKIKRTKPKVKRTKPKVKRTKPKVKRIKPKVKRIKPKVKRMKPKTKRTKPKTKRIKPKVKRTKPKTKRIKPNKIITLPVRTVVPQVCEEMWGVYQANKFLTGVMGGLGEASFKELCDVNNMCPYVLRVQTLEPSGYLSRKTFDQHVRYHTIAANAGIAPALYASWTCVDATGTPQGMMVMDRVDSSIHHDALDEQNITLSQNEVHTIIQLARQQLNKLHQLGIAHGTVESPNVVIKRKPNHEYEVFLTDFMDSKPLTPQLREKDMYDFETRVKEGFIRAMRPL